MYTLERGFPLFYVDSYLMRRSFYAQVPSSHHGGIAGGYDLVDIFEGDTSFDFRYDFDFVVSALV